MASFKLPPDPSEAKSYDLWKKDAEVWKLLTDVAEEKQGLALQYACRSDTRIHEAVMAVEPEKVKCKEGFANVVDVLDKLFKVDQKDAELKAYNKFETIRRGDHQKMADFIMEFDSVLNKTKSHGNVMNENLLGIKLMRAANLTNNQQQMITAIIKEVKYEDVKEVMKRMFGETTGIAGDMSKDLDDCDVKIKTEPIFKASHSKTECKCNCCDHQNHQAEREIEEEESEEALYGYGYGYNRFQRKPAGKFRKHNYQLDTGSKQQKFTKKGRNPLDPDGYYTRCNICDSINHYAAKCPDKELQGAFYQISLFENDLDDPISTQKLSQESIGAGIADTGATKTVCGKIWLDT